MAHTNLVLGDNWLRGEWPESVDVMHEGAVASLKYVPERTCTVEGLYSPGYSETDWGRCSRCCGVFPYQGDVVACPKCGAKVAEE